MRRAPVGSGDCRGAGGCGFPSCDAPDRNPEATGLSRRRTARRPVCRRRRPGADPPTTAQRALRGRGPNRRRARQLGDRPERHRLLRARGPDERHRRSCSRAERRDLDGRRRRPELCRRACRRALDPRSPRFSPARRSRSEAAAGSSSRRRCARTSSVSAAFSGSPHPGSSFRLRPTRFRTPRATAAAESPDAASSHSDATPAQGAARG